MTMAKKILVVDDEPTQIRLADQVLTHQGYEVLKASNGQEAIDKLKNNVYDICFMDIQMPVMGGLEAVSIIRREVNRDMPIIALTVSGMKEDETRALECGMNGYLTKPISREKLEEQILKWMNV